MEYPGGSVVGVLLVIVAMLVFAVAPMRYGRAAGKPTTASPAPAPAAPTITVATDAPPRPRLQIEARDPFEV